ncbi:MAG: DUF2945 domain-containing protein [bacterium]|nr:DUF2945 domain-containing protein [bacterium]
MPKELKKGDQVEWNTPKGKTSGTIKRKLTSPTKIQEHKVSASKDDPQFLVESEKSGKEAAHKPDSLRKKSHAKAKEKK